MVYVSLGSRHHGALGSEYVHRTRGTNRYALGASRVRSRQSLARSLVLLVELTSMLASLRELAKHAVSEGTKAVTKYTSNLAEKGRSFSRSAKAGLQFPVGRVQSLMKRVLRTRVSGSAPVYTAAVLEVCTVHMVHWDLLVGCSLTHERLHAHDSISSPRCSSCLATPRATTASSA